MVAYFVMEELGWKIYSLWLIVPFSFKIPVLFRLPESIRYLQSTGQYDQLIHMLQKIAKLKKKELSWKLNFNYITEKHHGLSATKLTQYQVATVIKSSFIFIASMISYYRCVFNDGIFCYVERKLPPFVT